MSSRAASAGPPLVVAVALANKTARIAWAMMLRERLWNRKFSLAKLSQEVRNFLHDYLEADVVFDPDAVGILIAAFDGALQSIKASRVRLSDEQIELVRGTLAKYIIEQARRGELDECRLRDGALLHLAQSNLRREPPQGHDKR